jgi:hypothetical protein
VSFHVLLCPSMSFCVLPCPSLSFHVRGGREIACRGPPPRRRLATAQRHSLRPSSAPIRMMCCVCARARVRDNSEFGCGEIAPSTRTSVEPSAKAGRRAQPHSARLAAPRRWHPSRSWRARGLALPAQPSHPPEDGPPAPLRRCPLRSDLGNAVGCECKGALSHQAASAIRPQTSSAR